MKEKSSADFKMFMKKPQPKTITEKVDRKIDGMRAYWEKRMTGAFEAKFFPITNIQIVCPVSKSTVKLLIGLGDGFYPYNRKAFEEIQS